MSNKNTERSLTKGPILRTLLAFALPMILGNLLQQVYNIADTVIVGRCIGAPALAAVGSSYTLMVFLTSIMIGLCMGGSAALSIAYGRKNREEWKEKAWMSFLITGAASILITAAVYLFTDQILKLLHVPSGTYQIMYTYLRIVFAGIVFTFLYNYFAYLLRAAGNSTVPLVFLGIASLLNIVLDLIFVGVFRYGVEGAAWATVISQGAAGMGLALYVLIAAHDLLPGREEMHFKKSILRELAGYSLLTCLQQSVMNLGILMIQGLVNSFGTVVMAAFAAAVKIDTIAYMPAQEFGNAYSLFVSQNYGAEKKERIRIGTGKAFLTAFLFCGSMSALIYVCAAPLMQLFVDASELEIIREGVRYLRIEGLFYIGIGFLFLFYGMYRGIGRPGFSLVLTVLSLGTRVSISYAVAPLPAFGVTAIWWTIVIGWFLADFAGFLVYCGSVKKKTLIYETEKEDVRFEVKEQGILRTMIEAVGSVYAQAEEKGVEIEIDSQHDLVACHDRHFTVQALIYMLENAVAYTDPGGKVTLHLTEERNCVGIQITDNGRGILQKDQPHIFKKYYRGRNVSGIEGYGIGLYLAQKIAEREHGRILCRSNLETGTTMTLYLSRYLTKRGSL